LGCSAEQIERWREELTITSKMFEEWSLYKYLVGTEIAGFYILENIHKGKSSLEFLFVSPRFIKQGIGKLLLAHAIQECLENNCSILKVLSVPNAAAFYEKQGFKVINKIESSIAGRFLPEMELAFF
jgi:GNAT superfamily N-acetyltransferase